MCAAHADALARMGLGTLKHANPQQVRFCRSRFAASCYNNLKPPLPRLRVCAAHADALARMGLGTLKHAKPQQVRFCRGRFAASCYNNLRLAAAAAARVRSTRGCAGAHGPGDIETCKTAASAVLPRPLRGIML
ncbi:hypothetical protein DXC43_05750 [Subdoligranulum sp. TF05-17AC]|nr:hypothetical protein DXC43_05750 [Subdoligranulum sp. TF05-17AC]